MFSKINLIIGGIIAVVLLGLGAVGGWNLYKHLHPAPVIIHDTISVVDPHWHHMYDSLKNVPPKETWHWYPRDTVKVPGDTIKLPADSAAIKAALKDYLATYDFGHEFTSDTIDANVGVRVTKNHPIAYSIDYRLKKPFTTIINQPQAVTNYSSYLQAGIEMPLQPDAFNSFRVEATAVFPKWYGGAGYQPLTKTFSARAGMTIFKIKSKK